MAIPELDEEGFLPEGIYPCTMEEIQDRFGRFKRSDQRVQLFARLQRYIKELVSTGFDNVVIVDGSFVTAKEEPSDIDLVLGLPEGHDMAATWRPFEYNTVSKRMVRKLYSFDVLVARQNSPEFDNYLAYFQQIKYRDDRRKGVLRLLP